MCGSGSIRVIWRWSGSIGSITERGSSRRTWVRSALRTRHSCRLVTARCSRSATHVAGPVDLERGNQVAAQGGDPFDEHSSPLDTVERAGVHAAVLVHKKVSVRGLKQGVVFGRLDVKIPGSQHLASAHRLEDRLGDGNDAVEGTAGVEEIGADRGQDPLVEVGAAAIVAEIVGAKVDAGDPENLRSREVGLGGPDARLRVATIRGRASASWRAVARLIGKRKSFGSNGADLRCMCVARGDGPTVAAS